jgi:phosphoribosyl 1,2-cyclic phosphate phosphodiesterase
MNRTLTILGCGSSGGVPRVGQGWGACDPANPRNRRRRCAVLIAQAGAEGHTNVLVDTGPDLREQLLSADVRHLDGVVLTHDHADHTHGIDDLRPLVIANRRRIDCYLDAPTAEGVSKRFDYIFRSPPGSEYPPLLNEHRVVSTVPMTISGAGGAIDILPFALRHGSIDALGLRIGNMAYTPDVNAIPDEMIEHLSGLDLWIIDALRIAPHPTHFHLAEALSWIERMRPKQAILTNLHNDLDYDRLCSELPPHIRPAYDGLVLAF